MMFSGRSNAEGSTNTAVMHFILQLRRWSLWLTDHAEIVYFSDSTISLLASQLVMEKPRAGNFDCAVHLKSISTKTECSRRLSYCNSAQDFILRFSNLPQAPLTTLLIFHSAAVQGPWTEDLDLGAPVRSTAASQGPQCQPRTANSQPKSWQGWCFQPTWHRPRALLTTGDPSRALEAVTKTSLSLVCYSTAVTQLPGRERYLLVLSTRAQPYKTVCPIPVGILHSQGCPTRHLPQGACAGSPPHAEEHLQPFVPTLTAGRSAPEGARAHGRNGEGGRSRPEGSQSRGQRLGPRPALGGGSAPQHGGGAPGAAPARPHGPGTRAGPALPPPRPPGKEPPLLRDLLAELRPRPLAWGSAGSSRPAGGVRRIPGRGGGESRECRTSTPAEYAPCKDIASTAKCGRHCHHFEGENCPISPAWL